MAPTLISLKTVLQRVPLSKSEIYRRIKAGSFPKQVRLGPSRIAFVETDVTDWITAKIGRQLEGGTDGRSN